MVRNNRTAAADIGNRSLIAVPPGTPAWIDLSLTDRTIAVWQPYYSSPLTVDDAVEMLLTVGNLFNALRK
jgi:hypothetical protein